MVLVGHDTGSSASSAISNVLVSLLCDVVLSREQHPESDEDAEEALSESQAQAMI